VEAPAAEGAALVIVVEIPLEALHSTIGRHGARCVRAAVLYEALQQQWDLLMENIGKGDFDTFNRVYRDYFAEDGPCRTTVEVNRLPTPIAIELKCIAAL